MQYKNLLLFFLIQIFCAFSINAQKLDSLLRELNNHKKEDTIRLKLLVLTGESYLNVDPNKGMEISDEAIALAQKLNRPNGLAFPYWIKGMCFFIKGKYSSAIESLQKSKEIAEQAGNKNIIARCYFGLGTINGASRNFPESLTDFQKASAIYEELGDVSMKGAIFGNIGNVYKGLSNFPMAIEFYEKAFDIAEKIGARNDMAANLGNIGLVFSMLGDFPKALEYHQKAASINEKTGNQNSLANNIGNIGLVYFNLSEFQKAIEHYQRALAVKEQIGNKQDIAGIIGNIGNCYFHKSDYPKALEYYQKALRINEEMGDKNGIAADLVNIGNIYESLSDDTKALEYYNRSLKLNKETDDEYNVAVNLLSIGLLHHKLSENSKALDYFKQALRIRQKLGMEDAFTLGVIGNTYNALHEYDKAFPFFQQSLSISNRSGEKQLIAGNFSGIGIAYLNMSDSQLHKLGVNPLQRFTLGLEYFKHSQDTAIKYGLLKMQRDNLQNLSTIYEEQKDYAKSIEAYKNFITIRDSMLNDEKKKQITRLEIQYEFSKKEDSLNLQQQITAGKLQQQVLLAKQQDQQLALNKNQLVLSNKEKDLQRLAYLKTQADLQNEQLLKQEKEKQLTLVEKEKQLQTVQVTTLSQENDLNKLKRRQQWFYSIGILVLLGLFASYFFYLNRLKQGKLKMELAKEKAEQEKKEAEFQRNLADVSLTALRSQMNPHFIFNCLNSIKLYTTQNDTASATDYLTKFSRLIRLVMENSRNDRISLTAELDALRLYIEMEAMRFKEKLSYTISVDKDVEMDYVEIPPLLLQPYVENAVWHGLMHKEKGGHIDITSAMKKNESLLEINITDNGVGRVKAEELRSKTATKHKSYGMKVTSERIALINQIYKTGANVVIHDVTNEKGEIAGTRVVIQIPV